MFGLPSQAVGWLAAGALLTVLGGLIRFQGWTFLLAGYDETSPVPDDVVANIAGNTVLRIGIAGIVLSAVIAVADTPSYLPLVVQAAIALAVVRLIYRLHTYTPENAA